MEWCFAIVKGEMKFIGFCHVNKSDYRTKMEKKYILEDTARFKFTYRNNVYKRLTN